MTNIDNTTVRYDVANPALIIDHLVVADTDVVREAQRWTAGERGEVVTDAEVLAKADLTEFARRSLSIGAQALSVVAQASDTRAVQQSAKAAGEQVAEAAERAAKASEAAAVRMEKQVSEAARRSNQTVIDQVARIFGGENPELLDRLRPVLEKSGSVLEKQVAASLTSAHKEMSEENERRHKELTALVRDVQQEVAVKIAEQVAVVEALESTTKKGGPYEDHVNQVLAELAVQFGDDYRDTHNTAGDIAHCKKGDGVLVIDGDKARVVVESHHGTSKDWHEYLPQAERNRGAAVSIGMVKNAEENAGHTFRRLGPTRVVLAFDPEKDDVDLLRAVVQFARHMALTTAGRFGTAEIETANEHVEKAIAALEDLDKTKKSFSLIRRHTEDVEKQINKAAAAIRRHLDSAATALEGADLSNGAAVDNDSAQAA